MSRRAPPPDSLEQHLRPHEQRLQWLRSLRESVEKQLEHCRQSLTPPSKGRDGSRDLVSLRYERDAIDREIRAHQTLLALGRDGKVRRVLEEVAGSLSLAREAARDPRGFAQARGIDVPRNMAVTVDVVGDHANIRAAYVDGPYGTTLQWSTRISGA